MYDVVIVGSGPAGALLAYLLAKDGFRVMLIEKASLPRYKTCGGGLPWKAVRSIPFDITPVLEREAIGGIVSYAGKQLLKTDVERPFAWLVMRDKFDYFLVQKAVEAGVHLLDGTTVTGVEQDERKAIVQTNSQPIPTKVVVGADGVNSIVAHSTGLLLKRRTGIAMEAEIEASTDVMQAQGAYATFDFSALPHGYGWIFPKKDHLSVGVFQSRPHGHTGLRKSLEKFIDCQEIIAGQKPVRLRAQRIPLGGQTPPLHSGRVLLVGDAANLADPWLGEGIYYALSSARIAAEEIALQLNNSSFHGQDYTLRIHTEISIQLRNAGQFAAMVYSFPRIGSILISRSQRMQDIVFGAIRGDFPLRDMVKKLIQNGAIIISQGIKK